VSRARPLALSVTLLAWAASAWAHGGGSTGYAAITVSRSTVRYSLTLPTSALPPDLAEALRLAGTGGDAGREKLLGLIRSKIGVEANGTRCESGPGEVLPSAADASSFTMVVDFACATAVRELVVRDDVFDVLGADHHTLA
jgi:hypothetical protein